MPVQSYVWQAIYKLTQLFTIVVVVLLLRIHTWAIPAFLIIYFPSIFLHELGHAIAVSSVGGRVVLIKLGKTVNPRGNSKTFRAFGYRWEIFGVPLTGSVFGQFFNLDNYRIRRAIVFAGGPIMSFYLMLMGALGIYPVSNFDLKTAQSYFDDSLLGVILANFYIFLTSVVPGLYSKRNPTKTDGLHIVESFYMTDEQIEARMDTLPGSPAVMKEMLLTDHLTIQQLIDLQKSKPDHLLTLQALVLRLLEDNDSRLSEYVEPLLNEPKLTTSESIKFLFQIITLRLLKNAVTQEPKSDQYSERLLELTRNSLTARCRRGCVLIDMTRIDEGKTMLTEVLSETRSDLEREFCLIFLAIAEERLGNLERADVHVQEAFALPIKTTVRNRLSKELKARFATGNPG